MHLITDRFQKSLSDTIAVDTMEKDLQLLGKNRRMEKWAQCVSKCRSSGLTVRNWCEQHGINEKAYYYWQNRIWKSMNEPRDNPGLCRFRLNPPAKLRQSGFESTEPKWKSVLEPMQLPLKQFAGRFENAERFLHDLPGYSGKFCVNANSDQTKT